MSWQGNHALERGLGIESCGVKKNLACGTFCPGSATRDKSLQPFVPEGESRFQNRDKWPCGTGTKGYFCSSAHYMVIVIRALSVHGGHPVHP